MESRHSSLPNIREQAYELAYKLACEQLARMDVEELCHKTGAQPMGSSKIIVEYLNRRYLVTFPDGEISLCDDDKKVPLKDRILILHYLTSAQGTPLTNKLITFKQLPGCASYFPVFSQLTIMPLLNHFGKEPELLINAAAKLGGHKAGYGDVSVTINAFPRVPVTIALWRGDDEFPPRGSIIFDSNISDYLSAEDIRDLCATIVWKLIKGLPYFPQ
jgi:hypothetical protein